MGWGFRALRGAPAALRPMGRCAAAAARGAAPAGSGGAALRAWSRSAWAPSPAGGRRARAGPGRRRPTRAYAGSGAAVRPAAGWPRAVYLVLPTVRLRPWGAVGNSSAGVVAVRRSSARYGAPDGWLAGGSRDKNSSSSRCLLSFWSRASPRCSSPRAFSSTLAGSFAGRLEFGGRRRHPAPRLLLFLVLLLAPPQPRRTPRPAFAAAGAGSPPGLVDLRVPVACAASG
ncbi:hypothetical protein U9M48_007957 [Paspalum notatum var. saurae]|uniref:Uncharacterized protein n=1 Tax=Paspalum notatum var. saurae TaxID=547442 RepID=A0AAQ3SN29_PASNO